MEESAIPGSNRRVAVSRSSVLTYPEMIVVGLLEGVSELFPRLQPGAQCAGPAVDRGQLGTGSGHVGEGLAVSGLPGGNARRDGRRRPLTRRPPATGEPVRVGEPVQVRAGAATLRLSTYQDGQAVVVVAVSDGPFSPPAGARQTSPGAMAWTATQGGIGLYCPRQWRPAGGRPAGPIARPCRPARPVLTFVQSPAPPQRLYWPHRTSGAGEGESR